jgi:hypothetical protein
MPGDFKIKISGDASEIVGASRQAGGALDDVAKKTGELGKEADKSSGFLKKLTGEAHEQRQVIAELAQQVPLLGSAMEILSGPEGIAFAFISGLLAMKDALDEVSEAADKTAEAVAKPEFSEAVEARTKDLQDGAVAAEMFANRMKLAAESQDHFALAAASAGAALAATNSAQRTVAEAAFGLDSAKLKAEYDAGLVTFEQYLARQLTAQIQHNKDMLDLAKQARKEQEDLLNSTVSGQRGEVDNAKHAAETLRAKATALKAQADRDAEELKSRVEGQAGLDKTAEGAESDLLHTSIDRVISALFTGDWAGTVDQGEHQAAFDVAQNEQRLNARRVATLRQRLPGEQTGASLAEQTAGAAETQFSNLVEALRQNTEALHMKREQDEIANRGDTVAMRDNNAALVYSSPLFSEFMASLPAAVSSLQAAWNQISVLTDRANANTGGRKPTF